jgi:hypothetical protein
MITDQYQPPAQVSRRVSFAYRPDTPGVRVYYDQTPALMSQPPVLFIRRPDLCGIRAATV